MSNTISIENIVTGYMVKYSRLKTLISEAFTGSSDTQINIMIDLYGLYHTILSRSFRTDTSDYLALVPAIVNMCVHYRQFFKKMGVSSKIFLVSSYNCPEISRKLVAGYNKLMVSKLENQILREMLEFNIKLLEILCPYLPDVHFLSTELESTVLMSNIIEKERLESSAPTLVITSDILPAQLCVKYDSVGVIRAKKYKGEDISMIINPRKYDPERFLKSFNDVVYVDARPSLSETVRDRVFPSNFVLLLALNGYQQRNIKVMMNSTVATRIINTLAMEIPMNIATLYTAGEAIKDIKAVLDRCPIALMENRYNALDCCSYMDWVFKQSPEGCNLNYENLIDPGALQMINSQYFPTNPLDLYRL